MSLVSQELTSRATYRAGFSAYSAPNNINQVSLPELLNSTGRSGLEAKQYDFLRKGDDENISIYYSGDLSVLKRPAVSIVGTREVTDAGRNRAGRLAKELSEANVAVMSGLAKGVDTAALMSAMDSGGNVVAVIGTPLDKAYPAENKRLQERIYTEHLLITPFEIGEGIYKSNFPKRNRVMAAVSDATVIVEAWNSSGTLHQAAECQRLGRWLFIMKSVLERPEVTWPSKFLNGPKTEIMSKTDDILRVLQRERA